jgi:homogentisate 1,2-dioxygenase
MNEVMGLIYGQYDAMAEGFVPGGASLHNSMSGHGPDQQTCERAESADLKPVKLENTLAFMFEMRYVIQTTQHAMQSEELQKKYFECWQGLNRRFTPPARK